MPPTKLITIFLYFTSGVAISAGPDILITLDPKVTSPFPPNWKRSFGSGHASLGLRQDWQDALARAAKDVGLAGIRQHGLFDDDMAVVSMDPAGKLVYNFTSVDILWDAHVKNGVRPIVELGFMPWLLANCSSKKFPQPKLAPCDTSIWVRTGATSFPKRWEEWYDLVHATVAHAVERYGLKEVREWHFEVWNELWGIPGGSETQLGEYMTLYNHSVWAVKSVDAALRVGGPAAAGAVVLPEFIAEAKRWRVPYDFISYHQYGNPRECPEGVHDGGGFYWNPDCYKTMIEYAKAQVPASVPLFITEYSVGVGEHRIDHDTSIAAAFIFRQVADLHNLADVLSYWTFSDIFEEVGFPTAEFQGVYGLETMHGISKPVRRAFELLHRYSGPRRIQTVIDVIEPAADTDLGGAETGCTIKQDLGCFNTKISRDQCFNISDMSGMGLSGLTLNSCLQYCWRNGAADSDGGQVAYVGLESGHECWCSSSPPVASKTCPNTPQSECNTTCNGNSSMSCGGSWRVQVYAVNCSSKPPSTYINTVFAFATADDAESDSSAISVFVSSWDVSSRQRKIQDVRVSLNTTGTGSAILYRIDENTANPWRAWQAMGSPAKPNTTQMEILQNASIVPGEPILPVDAGTVFDLQVPPNAAYLLRWVPSATTLYV